MKYLEYKNYFFIGIGGIGMSALAKYLYEINKNISGYDKVESSITQQLCERGIGISYIINDSIKQLQKFNPRNTLIIYTPAISNDNKILKYCFDKKFKLVKRAKVLSEIVNDGYCIAISGTHGKTTISSILSHILFKSKLEFTSFVGGIMNDYNSNLIINGNKIFIVEADEFDKSFLQLKPNIICINNIDADHLDIYKNYQNLENTFKAFVGNLKKDGIVFQNENLGFNGYKYGFSDKSDYFIDKLIYEQNETEFEIKSKKNNYGKVIFRMPGKHNALNALAAFSIAINLNLNPKNIISALESFSGIKRRFSIITKSPKILIDDYAHHPSEIESIVDSVKKMYPNKSNLVVFQPHLFSRTKDFMIDFAKALEKFDKIFLLNIYPAREEPIPGINSKQLLKIISNDNKKIVSDRDLLKHLEEDDSEVIITLGAGDISEKVESIKKLIIQNDI
ncbi:MAG: UDP-N-acetylmuramate--L-alanine ligase [Flavobacteriaceae bacterium]|nr:UDP-N-acetylmuramate--L-alanine ligase [Flavobacteriaceae bacterium]|tara:strand:- start:1980 stop:3332 length:1353 start_codon:yes stop_codon:yes gene_type:complete